MSVKNNNYFEETRKKLEFQYIRLHEFSMAPRSATGPESFNSEHASTHYLACGYKSDRSNLSISRFAQ